VPKKQGHNVNNRTPPSKHRQVQANINQSHTQQDRVYYNKVRATPNETGPRKQLLADVDLRLLSGATLLLIVNLKLLGGTAQETKLVVHHLRKRHVKIARNRLPVEGKIDKRSAKSSNT
jgi:hypothetical protein